MPISERLQIAKSQIRSAREYLLSNLDGLSEDDWFWMPESSFSHIAWQVGHLCMAQYGLTLFRQRGRAEIDTSLMSGKFRKKFMKGTTPSNDRENHPQRNEILDVLHRVNEQMLLEIDSFDGDVLDEPMEMPFAGFPTKYGSLLFAAHHEMLHAGQIGAIRRLMGKPPIR
ncbi:MAG: DinB family protein [Planctomycetota bacterium]